MKMEKRINGREIGDRLRKLRGDRTQAAVAEAVGVTTMSISQYEAGIRWPSDEVKIRLAEYFGVDIKDLFYT
jgi:transcriptional regulator with XRE-family HTH domain